jgi:hypothetical protein
LTDVEREAFAGFVVPESQEMTITAGDYTVASNGNVEAGAVGVGAAN